MLLTITTTHPPATDLGICCTSTRSGCSRFDAVRPGARLLPGGDATSAARRRCCSTWIRSGWSAAQGGAATRPARPVRQRPALRRLVVPERGDRPGLRHRARGPVQGPARSWPTTPLPLEARLAVAAVPRRRGVPAAAVRAARATRSTRRSHPLDEQFPEWGESPLLHRRARAATHASRELLTHLYVLVPVLDDDKHYWVGDDEVEKLLRHGEGWLAGAPGAGADRPPLPQAPAAA